MWLAGRSALARLHSLSLLMLLLPFYCPFPPLLSLSCCPFYCCYLLILFNSFVPPFLLVFLNEAVAGSLPLRLLARRHSPCVSSFVFRDKRRSSLLVLDIYLPSFLIESLSCPGEVLVVLLSLMCFTRGWASLFDRIDSVSLQRMDSTFVHLLLH